MYMTHLAIFLGHQIITVIILLTLTPSDTEATIMTRKQAYIILRRDIMTPKHLAVLIFILTAITIQLCLQIQVDILRY